MTKKYQVFISSTFIDLVEARHKVMDTILALHQIPAGMEMFPAADDDQWTHIKSEIDASDYYILILGHRYGSVATDGISYTEKEYDYAREQGIPVLAFIMNRDVPVNPSFLDDSATSKKRLQKFIQKATTSKLCKFWNTSDELATMVSTSLSHSFTTNGHERVGWVRGDKAITPAFTEELVSLSKENRALKKELEEYQKFYDKSPLIIFGFNDDEPLVLDKKRLDFNILSVPEVINRSTIPKHLCEFINQESIDQYNSSIPDDIEKVTNYNNKLKIHTAVDTLGKELRLKIGNEGSGIANKIFIDIEFPDSIMIFDGAKEDFPMPAVPSMTPNPINKAESSYQAKVNGFNNHNLQKALGFLNLDYLKSYSTPMYSALSSKGPVTNQPRTLTTNLNGNNISLYCTELLHTRMRTSNDRYTIFPLKAGEYEIKVSIICEEYPKTDEFTIPLIINEA